ncbi:hypothetical protein [Actinoallomurus sp. CA-150999]|uniref:hypothetical protein n=1 Tax=Actinoallomurus sp. CA-150999 TaxID=3239887 RepID=UPI003D941FC9
MPINSALRAAIEEAGWTLAQTSSAVNTVGAENGLRLYYDRTSISHWLSGTVPRKDALPCAVEAFARRLARPMSPQSLGWPDTGIVLSDLWAGEVLMRLTQIGRDDMLDRRTVLTTGVYSLAALAVPAAPSPRQIPSGAEAAQRIRETTRHLAQLDDLYGGGAARSTVAAYLTHDVVPMLRVARGPARAEMFSAAADCAYLAAWMAADDMRSALAQQYYVQAVRLADEAGDPIARGRLLRSLALQALELGHTTEALDIADAAVTAIRRGCPARTQAWILGMRAEALAAANRGPEARTVMRSAERLLEAADSPPEYQWTGSYRRESWQHQAGTLLASLGDLAEAEGHLAASVATRQPIERRTRALIGTRLARVQYRRGDRDAATQTLGRLRDDIASVTSARIDHELAAFPHELVPARPSRERPTLR